MNTFLAIQTTFMPQRSIMDENSDLMFLRNPTLAIQAFNNQYDKLDAELRGTSWQHDVRNGMAGNAYERMLELQQRTLDFRNKMVGSRDPADIHAFDQISTINREVQEHLDQMELVCSIPSQQTMRRAADLALRVRFN